MSGYASDYVCFTALRIAQNLPFKSWDELGHSVIRLGGFHTLGCFGKSLASDMETQD